jgi:hypothetical protein
MFQLSAKETNLIFQFGRSNPPGRGGRRHRRYAFTEQGVAMLSSVLRSERAGPGSNWGAGEPSIMRAGWQGGWCFVLKTRPLQLQPRSHSNNHSGGIASMTIGDSPPS